MFFLEVGLGDGDLLSCSFRSLSEFICGMWSPFSSWLSVKAALTSWRPLLSPAWDPYISEPAMACPVLYPEIPLVSTSASS